MLPPEHKQDLLAEFMGISQYQGRMVQSILRLHCIRHFVTRTINVLRNEEKRQIPRTVGHI